MDTGGVGKWKITVSDGLLELSFRIWINFLFKMFIIKEINTIYPPVILSDLLCFLGCTSRDGICSVNVNFYL